MTQDTESPLTLADLKPGDVLIMEGDLRPSNPTRYLDELIMLLNDSDVCHGAIFIGKDSSGQFTLIDDALNGVGIRPIRDSQDSSDPRFDTWYVRRMASDNLEPVIAQAQTYLGKAYYDKAWLVMLGLLLIVKDITPSGVGQSALLEVLKFFAYELDKHLFGRPGETGLVCSQFVAVSFDGAGPAYQLQIKPGRLAGQQSIEALRAQAPIHALALGSNDVEGLMEKVRVTRGLSLGYSASGGSLSSLLASIGEAGVSLVKGLGSGELAGLQQSYASYQANFVTPACLKEGCTNLSAIGKVGFHYGD